MVVFEIDEYLEGAGIVQIKTTPKHELYIRTSKGNYLIEIQEDEESTGFEIERKCKVLHPIAIQKIHLLLHKYWNDIQNEINPAETTDPAEYDPERYPAKHHFDSFEEWLTQVENHYHKLRKIIEDNLPFTWIATEFVLMVKAILHIKEITLPFLALLIGRAGGGKTVPIESLRGRNHTYYTDNFNPQAMVSHIVTPPSNAKEGDQHMILRIRKKLVLAPELAPLFFKTGRRSQGSSRYTRKSCRWKRLRD